MHRYRLFGGVLASDVVMPELESAGDTTADWTLRSHVGPVPEEQCECLGTDVVTGPVRAHLFRREHGLRLRFDDTGCFDISADGRTIDWYHDADVSVADACADLTGRVLAAALHVRGILTLHASAVVIDSAAIAFVAPKHHGKSTLALALVHAGARLLTDDTLAVEPGSPPIARAGLHATRLWSDSARRVGIGTARPESNAPAATETSEVKQLFPAPPVKYVSHESHPLRAIYLLAPRRDPLEGRAVWRTRLSPVESVLSVIGHAKIAPLLTGSEVPRLVGRATTLAESVSVFRLSIVRDLDRLDDVVSTLLSWHAAPTATAAG